MSKRVKIMKTINRRKTQKWDCMKKCLCIEFLFAPPIFINIYLVALFFKLMLLVVHHIDAGPPLFPSSSPKRSLRHHFYLPIWRVKHSVWMFLNEKLLLLFVHQLLYQRQEGINTHRRRVRLWQLRAKEITEEVIRHDDEFINGNGNCRSETDKKIFNNLVFCAGYEMQMDCLIEWNVQKEETKRSFGDAWRAIIKWI